MKHWRSTEVMVLKHISSQVTALVNNSETNNSQYIITVTEQKKQYPGYLSMLPDHTTMQQSWRMNAIVSISVNTEQIKVPIANILNLLTVNGHI